jgi:hypothetical protein
LSVLLFGKDPQRFLKTREEEISIPGAFEIPKEIISEAIVNSLVAHRDYTSGGSVQIMLFKYRLEIWNPGALPVIYRKAYLSEATPEVERLIRVMDGEKGRLELQLLLTLKDEKYFRNNFKQKSLDLGLIEMTIPSKPTSGNQKYRLTALGKKLKEKFEGQDC